MSNTDLHTSDLDAIQRIIAGDKGAYEELFRSYYAPLCRYSLKYLNDELVSEEIVQEVFINIWERRESLTHVTAVKPYLYTAVKNRSFNYLKNQLPRERNKIDIEDMPIMVVESHEDDYIGEEIKTFIAQAIDNLPVKSKMVFQLSRNAGMTYAEISEEMDISVKTVESQMGRALRILRVSLDPIKDKIVILFWIFFQ